MHRIKESFDQIHADQELIDSTKTKLRAMRSLDLDMTSKVEQIHNPKVRRRPNIMKSYRRFSPAVACLLILFIFLASSYGYRINARAVSYISIDASPSIELTLNQKDKVLEAKAYNTAGENVLSGLDLQGMSYEEAIECIMNCEVMKKYLSEDSNLNFSVISHDQEKGKSLQQGIEGHHSRKGHYGVKTIKDTYLYDNAHEYSMSFGKYHLYLELSKYDSNLTAEQCHEMSVDEMEHEINCHQNQQVHSEESDDSCGGEEEEESRKDHKKESEKHGKEHH